MPHALNPRHAVYAGSFDPVSLGHKDIIERGARMFERVTVGVGINPEKSPLFTPQERLALFQQVLQPFPDCAGASFDGLAGYFRRRCRAAPLLRGLLHPTALTAAL